MRKLQWCLHILGLTIVAGLALCLLQGGAQPAAAATTMDDGIYVVPAKIIKADSTATSSANQFFGDYAAVRVKDQQATVLLTSNGSQYIKSMTIDKQPVTLVKQVDGQAIYQVNLAKLTSPLPATFKLATPMGKMQEQARLTLDWAKAERDSDSTTTVDLLKQATALISKGDATQPVVPAKTTKTTKPAATTKSTKSTTPAARYWKYQVLKADAMAPSDANQYYTHTAKVVPADNGYRVFLTVSYAKSLKLGPRAVVPKEMDGVTVPASRVAYGQTAKNYTMTYWFPISSTRALTAKLVPGKIHVTVPMMSISETFPVRFQFAASGSADKATAAAVAALPETTNKRTAANETTTTPHHQSVKRTLPATGDAQHNETFWGVLGLLASGLVAWEAKRHA